MMFGRRRLRCPKCQTPITRNNRRIGNLRTWGANEECLQQDMIWIFAPEEYQEAAEKGRDQRAKHAVDLRRSQ